MLLTQAVHLRRRVIDTYAGPGLPLRHVAPAAGALSPGRPGLRRPGLSTRRARLAMEGTADSLALGMHITVTSTSGAAWTLAPQGEL